MKYRYSIVDDKSDLVVGYCNKINGLSGKKVTTDNSVYHRLVLSDFIFCDGYKQYLRKMKARFEGLLYINIHDNDMKIMAQFYFANHTNTKHTEFYTIESNQDLEVIGYLADVPSKNELKLWEKWIDRFPKQKNEWVVLDEDGRRDWLRMLRIAYCSGYKKPDENNNDIFYLDGKNITTYDSFFIAFAEALNGPGSYYGSSLDGLEDCLCGGFGVVPPFKLIWHNAPVAVENLNENEWKRHRISLKKSLIKSLDSVDYQYTLNLNIFHEIVNVLLRHNVEVVLKP